MDATQKLSKNTALFLVTALWALTAGVAQGQTLVADPTSVVLTSIQGTGITITSTGAAITYTISKPNWVTVTGGTTTPTTLFAQINTGCTAAICPAGNITLTPTSPTGLTALNIPVSFNASGGGTGVISASTNNVPFSIVNNGTASSTVSITTSGSPVNISTVTNPVPWLTCSLSATQVSNGAPATLNIFVSGVNYPNTTQNSSCTVTPSTGAAVIVTVSMAVGTSSTGGFTFSQNNLAFSYPCGTCTGFVQVNSSATNSYSAQVSSSNGWLLASGNAANGGNGVSLSVNTIAAASLATGNYQGTVLLTNSGNGADTATIIVNLSVNGGTGNGIFSPSSLSFTASLNGAVQTQTVSITSGTLTFASASGCSWVGVSQPSSNQLTVQVFPSSLSVAQTYTCNITATVSGTNYAVPVTLFLGNSGGGGSTGGVVAPSSLTFTGQAGAANAPSFQQVTVTGSGPISVSTTYGSGSQPFISATGSASAPGLVTVFVTSGLAAGTYSGTLGITVNGNTQNVPVTYNVTSGAAIIANPSTINVSSDNGASIAPVQLSLTASDNSTLPVTVQSSATWVTVGAGSSSGTPANFLITVNPAGLPNGINTANLTVNGSGSSNNPMTIPVVVLVNGSTGGGTGNLTLSSSTLTYSTSINGGSPASQQLTVNGPNNVATSFSVSASTSNCGGNWITVSPAGTLTTPQTLTVSVNAPTNVSVPTQCTGVISLQSGGLTQTVQVVENIGNTGGGGGGTGNITVSPTSLSFSYQVGSTSTPPLQGLMITSTPSGVGITVAATTTSGGNWLSTGNVTSTTAPVTLSISVNVTGLAAGTYKGNVRITPNGGVAVDLPVTLTVQSLEVTASPAVLNFTYRAGDAAPANQNITVSGVSGLTFTATPTSNGNWLSVSPASGTTTTGGNTLQVAVNGTGLAAGNYTGTIAVLGTGTASGSTTITVNLSVTAPLPTITRVTNAASYATGSLSAGEVITIFGTNIGPSTLTTFALDSNGKVPTTLGSVQVLVGGYPAAMLYVRNDQVSAIVPYEIASPFLASPNVVIKYLGQSSNGFPMNQVAAAPGIFTSNQSGTGPGAILNGNSSVNSSNNAAAKGEIIQIYLTGEGQTSPAGVSASVTPSSANTPKPLLPVAVLIDGQPANVTFFGEAPGLVAGVLQVNAQIPANAGSGDRSVQVNIGGNTSQSGVTVSIR